ncbi:Rab proteins geranylgeranyltransferase component A [Agyrium rufum]|nr:Rab proteins geranylgeranyltransferase component A [Agyrium rufum]
MESLDGTEWDIVLVGTGLPQSLLALALSRSGKRILHLDRHDYYGGAEAALSLQDAEAWVKSVNDGLEQPIFSNASIHHPSDDDTSGAASKLGFSRAYSLCLAPQMIYCRSVLLPTLVSSKVYRQLEFLALGNWWMVEAGETPDANASLRKIPSSKEDVFTDESIDRRSKRALTNFLRSALDLEGQEALLLEWGDKPFLEFLEANFHLSTGLQGALHALTLSPTDLSNTKTSFALPRITRHLTSIGIFGPGFGSVIPKWGGLGEITQVACRAGAVGGGIYVLNNGVHTIEAIDSSSDPQDASEDRGSSMLQLQLQGDEKVKTQWLLGYDGDLSTSSIINARGKNPSTMLKYYRSIAVVSSPLSSLFETSIEGAPPSAGAVVTYPVGSLRITPTSKIANASPVYLSIHTSDTGECPNGQCIIYASTLASEDTTSHVLNVAIHKLLSAVVEDSPPKVIWTMSYAELRAEHVSDQPVSSNEEHEGSKGSANQVIILPNMSADLSFDDGILAEIRLAWIKITGLEEGFLTFEDRELGVDDEE